MNCQVTNLDLCQLKQETFHSPTFGFGDIDVSDDQFIFSTFKSFGSAKKEHPVNWVDENTVYIESLNLPFGDYFHELIWIHGTQRDVVVQGRLKVTDKGNDCGCEPKNNYEIKVVTSETTVNINYSERVIERITDKGPQGDSAYQVAVDNGFVGTEAEWLESLKLHYSDLTEAEILELQQPAIEAAQTANQAADNANAATQNAITATNEANTATVSANQSAQTANASAINAGNSADLATSAATNANNAATAANTAANFANSQRGWSPKFVFEEDGAQRLVKKLDSWIGGTGTAPTDNVGMYVVDGGYTTDKSLATNFKGEQSDNLIAEYVHSGNKEVYIDSIDYDTNTFTSVWHGLVENEIVSCLPIFDKINSWTQDLMLLLPFSTNVLRNLHIINVTSNTFQVSSTQSGTPLVLSQKETVSNDSFKFEVITTANLQFNNINQNNVRIVCTGFNANSAWFDLSTNDGSNNEVLGGRPSSIFFSHMPNFMSVETKIQYKKGLYNKRVSVGNFVGTSGNQNINQNVVWKNTGRDLTQVHFNNRYNYNGFTIQIFKL